MDRRTFVALLGSTAIVQLVEVDGLKDGLKELGLAERKHYVLEIRDLKGDRKAAEEAARGLEQGKVDLIYAVSTSVTVAVKQATRMVPIMLWGQQAIEFCKRVLGIELARRRRVEGEQPVNQTPELLVIGSGHARPNAVHPAAEKHE